MAATRSRKRKPRASTNPGDDEVNGGENSPEQRESSPSGGSDSCAECKQKDLDDEDSDKTQWIQCGACKSWFHWKCTPSSSETASVDSVDKWFCAPCRDANPARIITFKGPPRKSSRQKKDLASYASLAEGLAHNPTKWVQWLDSRKVIPDNFKRMDGKDVGVEWLAHDPNAMTEPIVVEQTEGLGLTMPSPGFTVADVVASVGEATPVEVIDCAAQQGLPNWNLGRWGEYYATPSESRDKIRNVISLEISNTKLAESILPPRLVRDLDWVDKFWPSTKKAKPQVYPKVQLYCLMGVENAWTDWHVDFAGSSVYYHIVNGEKVFYFVRPTPANLEAYKNWSGSEAQSTTWYGDLVDEVVKVHLHAGNTMFIPSGWIHAVYTPVDALVFGGNFLHSYSIPTQLRVREIELATGVPKKFQFPHFPKLCWYVGEKYLRDIRAKEEFSERVLEGVAALADFLVGQVRLMERSSDSQRREAKDAVPTDRIKDAPAVARELRWRVRQALDAPSDDEATPWKKTQSPVKGTKRKRETSELGSPSADDYPSSRNFKNFRPKAWDQEVRAPIESERRVVHVAKSDEVPLAELVKLESGEESAQAVISRTGGEEGEYETKVETIVRARRLNIDGMVVIERQRITRLLETWTLSQ
ncbi:Clavaminate synthase-like protein [Auriculariales sp. MPI-PUGE-AT-0066]|nr:Clavaminate synthase-like protein [Auriculariales sp. MPI-PUGE-AT-0066]